MPDNEQEIGDTPISNQVDLDLIRNRLKMEDHNIAQFTKLGGELLVATERPNIITLDQFEPFIAWFNADRSRMETDEAYRRQFDGYLDRWVNGLGINLYQPTIVIRSKDNPEELYFLDRRYTRFKSDLIDGRSNRELIPSVIAKTANTTRDQKLLEASVMDLVEANQTPEQREYFARAKIDSAIINKNFFERNLSPDKKAEILAKMEAKPESLDVEISSGGIQFTLDDDDD